MRKGEFIEGKQLVSFMVIDRETLGDFAVGWDVGEEVGKGMFFVKENPQKRV